MGAADVPAASGWPALPRRPARLHAFVVLFFPVEHLARVQWRDPLVPAIAAPYLVLFFGSIVLMGLPMYRLDRRRWLVTVTTSVILPGSMVYAMAVGVG